MDLLEKRIVLINSKDRLDGGTTYDFRVNGPRDLVNPAYYCLHSVSLMNTFYNITAKNNTFSIKVGSTTINSTIDPRYYTVDTLVSILNTKVNENLALNGIPGNLFLITYDSTAYKITLSIDITRSFTLIPSPLAKNLGFKLDNYPTTTSLVADSLIDLTPINRIFIHSNIAQTNASSSSNKTASLMAVIPNNSGFGESITVITQNEALNLYRCSRDLSTISVSLRDSDNTLLDNNGLDWSLSIIVYYYIK